MTPEDVTEELLTSELRGRGGAFFATGRKWSFVPSKEQIPKPHYLVVNADESEPGSFKDNEILSRVPHRFIEGCLITAHAIDCSNVFVYIRGEYSGPYEILVAALEELKDRPEIRGDVTIVVHRGAGAYICGEETALLESLEGKRGQPRSKPPFPAISGLYASPTVVNNVETIATVAPIIAMGGAEYAKLGVENSRGTRVVSLSGNVVNGGNYEIEPGMSLREIIYDLGGGIPDGRELKAVVPGGSSTVILTRDEIDVGYDFDSLAAAAHGDGLGGDRRARRPLLHRAARHPLLRVLRARVVRQVHAVPRGHALADRDPAQARGRARDAARPRPAARRLRPDQRQVPLPARRLRRDHRRVATSRSSATSSSRAHRRGRLPVRRHLVARPRARAGRRCTAHSPVGEVR